MMGIGEEAIIDISGIAKRYRRGNEAVTALENVSLRIRQSELVAITGASGSGKTTLAHIIGGLMTPDEGSVTVHGANIGAMNDRLLSAYRNRYVGFVFQNFSLIPHYSAIDNVMLPMTVSGVAPGKRREHAERLLKRVGLQGKYTRRADKLSGGERQRVSIARALAMNPRIIIADEPTGSLDSARGKEIMTILELLATKHAITVIVVTHDPLLAARAHRVVTLKDGKIIGGAHAK